MYNKVVCVVSKGTILKFDSSQSAPNVKYFCILLQKKMGLAPQRYQDVNDIERFHWENQ